VHVLGPLVKAGVDGQRLFEDITPAAALKALREILVGIGLEQAEAYRCHDFRRGHALDLQLSGTFCLRVRSMQRVVARYGRCATLADSSCRRMALSSFLGLFGHP